MNVSVVIPTFRRPDLLRQVLMALMRQTLPMKAFEVLVCDDAAEIPGEREKTLAVITGLAATFALPERWIRYLPVKGNHGPAAARNHGIRNARGRVIAFTDDDTLPDPRWLETGIRAFVGSGPEQVIAVWGRVEVPLPECPTDYEKDAAGLDGAEFVTANCFCDRETLQSLGGFDERFRAAWREDSDLYFRLMQLSNLDRLLIYEPSAIVVHPIRPAKWGISLSQAKKVRYNALLYKKHPSLYRAKIQKSPPLHYYAQVATLATLAAAVIWKHPVIAAVLGLIWLVCYLRFSLARLKSTSRSPSHVAEMLFTSALLPPLAVYWRIRGALEFRVLFF